MIRYYSIYRSILISILIPLLLSITYLSTILIHRYLTLILYIVLPIGSTLNSYSIL